MCVLLPMKYLIMMFILMKYLIMAHIFKIAYFDQVSVH